MNNLRRFRGPVVTSKARAIPVSRYEQSKSSGQLIMHRLAGHRLDNPNIERELMSESNSKSSDILSDGPA